MVRMDANVAGSVRSRVLAAISLRVNELMGTVCATLTARVANAVDANCTGCEGKFER